MSNLQGNQLIGNIRILNQTYCRICQKCGYLNYNRVASCDKCRYSMLGEERAEMQDVLHVGVKTCPTCLGLYCAGPELCISCQIPLVLLFALPRPLSPNDTSLSPCPKCSRTTAPQAPFCDFCGRLLQIEYPYYYEHDPRPTILIQLRNGEKTIKCVALVDSGASTNLFHGFLATVLDVDKSQALPTLPMSVGGVTVHPYDAPIEIGLLGKFYQTRVLFADDYPLTLPGLLGHYGFFDRFDVDFDNESRHVEIKERDILFQKQYRFCPNCGRERKNTTSLFCVQCGTSLMVPSSIVNGHII